MKKIQNIVLDIDQTLLDAHLNPDNNTANTMSDYTFFLRPYLARFLNFLFEHFNVAIWTAADTEYAHYVVNNIIAPMTGRRPQFIMSRPDYQDCLLKGLGHKNLVYLSQKYPQFDYNKTIIIDDLDYVKATNGVRCIALPKFLMDNPQQSKNDTALLSLMNALKITVLNK
jgi:TFIIF-interacting CTD phosphatase-like protein